VAWAIIRAGSNNRIFPFPDADFYCVAPPRGLADDPRPSGARIISLADAPLPKWVRWTGYGLSPVDRIARMLALHRRAFDAERRGRAREADFFWREAIREIACISPKVWGAVWEAHGKEIVASAEELRKRVVCEVFADVHAAFVNARLDKAEAPPPSDLAFRHMRYLGKVLPLAGMTPVEQATMIAPGLQAEIEALEKVKLWNKAIAVARLVAAILAAVVPPRCNAVVTTEMRVLPGA
jgi:hypothetical protein